MAKHKKFKLATLPLGLLVALLVLIIITFEVIFDDKFFPKVYIGDTHLAFLTKPQAYQLLSNKFNQRLQNELEFVYDSQTFKIDLATASSKVNTMDVIDKTFQAGHQKNWSEKIVDQIKLLAFGSIITPDISISLNQQINTLEKNLYKDPKDARIDIIGELATTSAQVKVTEGSFGQELDKDKLEKVIKNYIAFASKPSVLPLKLIEPKITTEKANKAKQFIEESAKEPVKLDLGERNWIIDSKTLISLLDLSSAELIDKDRLSDYLANLSKEINQPLQEGQFNFDPGTQRVIAFKPSQEGKELDSEKTAALITLALEGVRAKTITLPVNTTLPKIRVESVNNLGIKELIGRGISNFAGSIPNRIYNLTLAASKINGVLIPPGEIFSFNNTVGDITAETGFKQAYVIKSGRTVLDDGGGVCQDSTTLFRAVLNAGLPVISRTAHAYRVGYYEQGFPPGLDATTYYPSVDFKFKNDTQNYILIQAYTSGLTLYVDLYGTSDGRISTISKSTVTNQSPPPPELRQDDPTLEKGVVKQVDFPAWGATVSFNRTVRRAGEILINETFRSNYKPWQAVYLVGTKEN